MVPPVWPVVSRLHPSTSADLGVCAPEISYCWNIRIYRNLAHAHSWDVIICQALKHLKWNKLVFCHFSSWLEHSGGGGTRWKIALFLGSSCFFTAVLWKMVSSLRCGCTGQTLSSPPAVENWVAQGLVEILWPGCKLNRSLLSAWDKSPPPFLANSLTWGPVCHSAWAAAQHCRNPGLIRNTLAN